jgi:two-component system LytT family response regulator
MSQEITCIIVDDEQGARTTLKAMLDKFCPEVNCLRELGQVDEALEFIYKEEPDIIFLDIEMPGKSGLELANLISETSSKVIFTTAYSKYALNAIKASAFEYLLKPLDVAELRTAIQKFKKSTLATEVKNGITASRRIAIPSNEGFELVDIEKIIYCEASSNYTTIILNNNKAYLASKTLKEYEELLPVNTFCRVHQKYLVNMSYVEKFIKGRGGELILSNGKIIPVSQNKRSNIYNYIVK